ncbi:unnamed protein product, partial [Cylicocyclus nassatus]
MREQWPQSHRHSGSRQPYRLFEMIAERQLKCRESDQHSCFLASSVNSNCMTPRLDGEGWRRCHLRGQNYRADNILSNLRRRVMRFLYTWSVTSMPCALGASYA